jgi:hypothetical protein
VVPTATDEGSAGAVAAGLDCLAAAPAAEGRGAAFCVDEGAADDVPAAAAAAYEGSSMVVAAWCADDGGEGDEGPTCVVAAANAVAYKGSTCVVAAGWADDGGDEGRSAACCVDECAVDVVPAATAAPEDGSSRVVPAATTDPYDGSSRVVAAGGADDAGGACDAGEGDEVEGSASWVPSGEIAASVVSSAVLPTACWERSWPAAASTADNGDNVGEGDEGAAAADDGGDECRW